MFASAWRGSRWIACGLGVAALFAAVLMIAPASGTPGSQTAAAAKKCTKATVNGRHACLRKGDKCKKAYQDDYVAAGFSCKKGRLRKASIKQLRNGQPLLISDKGEISLDTALAAFDDQIAPLPGVDAKPGEVGKLTDATMAFDRIGSSLGELTAAQRQVYEQWTAPAPDAIVIDPANLRATPRLVNGRKAPPTLTEYTTAKGYVDDAIRVLRNHGYFLAKKFTLSLLDDQGTQASDVYAYVPPDDIPPGTSSTCDIFVTRLGRNQSASDLRFILSHETAHCVQHAFYSNQADKNRVPIWVREGSAEYLGARIIQELGGSTNQVAWGLWLLKPKVDLFKRGYDAVGFYAMLEQAGVDTWARIKQIISGGVNSGPSGAYSAAIAGVPDIFYQRWGPGLIRDPALGPEWDYTGPFIDPVLKASTVQLGTGAPVVSAIEPHASAAGILKISADIVTIKAPKGLRGLIRFGGTQAPLKTGAYCAKTGGCKCKTNTNLQLPEIGATTNIGFSDPQKARTVTIQGRKLKDYCKNPTPGPAPGGGGGGGSCPTTPGGGTARRGCPGPAAGIMVYDDPEATSPIANFTIGSCTQGAGGFTAIATSGAYRLEIGISNFSGFGDYEIPYGGPDPLVVLEGPFGEMSNATWQPGGLSFAGAISFQEGDRHNLGVGWIEFRTADQSAATTAAGGMTCVYPDDEP